RLHEVGLDDAHARRHRELDELRVRRLREERLDHAPAGRPLDLVQLRLRRLLEERRELSVSARNTRRRAERRLRAMKWLWVVLACACSAPTAPARSPDVQPIGPATPPVVVTPPPPKLVARGSLAAGDHHVCAVRATGRVACWGQGGTRLGVPGSTD